MAIIAIAILKQVAFRDSVQEFSNVYHYNVSITPNSSEAANRITEIETFEKSIHASIVSFLRGRCWTAGGSPSENAMIQDVILSGNGSLTQTTGLDRERAFLVQWPAGVDSRNRVVYLRKWWHTCAAMAGVTVGTAQTSQSSGFSNADQIAIENKATEITEIGTANEYDLCSASGRVFQGPAQAHPYLEHRQLGDQWRDT